LSCVYVTVRNLLPTSFATCSARIRLIDASPQRDLEYGESPVPWEVTEDIALTWAGERSVARIKPGGTEAMRLAYTNLDHAGYDDRLFIAGEGRLRWVPPGKCELQVQVD